MLSQEWARWHSVDASFGPNLDTFDHLDNRRRGPIQQVRLSMSPKFSADTPKPSPNTNSFALQSYAPPRQSENS